MDSKTPLVPVILAGGSGTRLWPLSRKSYPKQFLTLFDNKTLFQDTLLRLQGLPNATVPLIVCHEEYRFIALAQAQECIRESAILLEPEAKNTAAAIALAAFYAKEQYPDQDPLLLCLSADQRIEPKEALHKAVNIGIPFAHQGHDVIFGVPPTHPETGYGYIHKGQAEGGAYHVNAFREKPDLVDAKTYYESGDYLWNSGIFLFKCSVLLKQLQDYAPMIFDATQKAMANLKRDQAFVRPNSEAFSHCPSNSIDYAIMEYVTDSRVVNLEANWSDVGSWRSVAEQYEVDDLGNASQGDVVFEKTTGSFVHASHRLVTTVGVDNVVVIETKDAVLVLNKDRSQDLKSLVSKLATQNRAHLDHHTRVERPWGAFESIDAGPRFQVKRITVKVGEKLSLQMHHHRSEHWVVVKGSARVTRNDDAFLLTENESVYIPIGAVHRLENVGKIPLELIEVQSGSYLGEDDIVRLEDVYGRNAVEKSAV